MARLRCICQCCGKAALRFDAPLCARGARPAAEDHRGNTAAHFAAAAGNAGLLRDLCSARGLGADARGYFIATESR